MNEQRGISEQHRSWHEVPRSWFKRKDGLMQSATYQIPALLLKSVVLLLIAPSVAMGQDLTKSTEEPPRQMATDELSAAPDKIEINPVALDEEIGQRLKSVLDATGWFMNPDVTVTAGVVILSGETETAELRKWAGDLARNTQDVAAVANRIEVLVPSIWDFRLASEGLFDLWRDFVVALPFFALGLIVLAMSVGAAIMVTNGAKIFFGKRVKAHLLRNVFAYGFGILTFLLGVYIVLRVSGLTQLALTVVGGTGLVGLAVGIAFRDITENFLASVFLSIQRPFETGDLIEVAGVTGFVQQLNVRTTVVMNLNGNLTQIPNASVYKSNLRNFTTNANRCEDFVVGIGYNDSINQAQEIAQQVLHEHEAILNDPAPSVLVDSLGASTVNLRVFFWFNGRKYSWLKVRSSVIRLIKRAFQKNSISMPDGAREVVFTNGIAVNMIDASTLAKDSRSTESLYSSGSEPEELDSISTKAEAGLYSEATDIEKQAKNVKPLNNAENLLQGTPATYSKEE